MSLNAGFLAAPFANAETEMWPGCSPIAPVTYTDPGTYSSTGCKILTFVTITVDNIVRPAPPSQGDTSVRISSAVVSGNTGGIRIVGPAVSTAGSKVPLIVTVEHTSFRADAILMFVGAFSPGSALIIQNNSVTFSGPNTAYALGYNAGIILLAYVIELSSNAAISIKGNSLVQSTGAGTSCLIYMNYSSVVFSQGSAIQMNDNTVMTSLFSGNTHAIYWESPSAITICLTNGSSIVMSNNTISAPLIGDSTNVVYWRSNKALTMWLLGSNVALNGNTIQYEALNAQVKICSVAMLASSTNVTLQSQAKMEMSENRVMMIDSPMMCNTIYGVNVWSASNLTLTLLDNSTLLISNNTVTGSAEDVRVINVEAVAAAKLSLSGNSNCEMSQNIGYNMTSGSTYVANLLADVLTLSLSSGSAMRLASNQILRGMSYADSTVVAIRSGTAAMNIYISSSARLSTSNNTAFSSNGSSTLRIVHFFGAANLNSDVSGGGHFILNDNSAKAAYFRNIYVLDFVGGSSGIVVGASNSSFVAMKLNSAVDSHGLSTMYIRVVRWSSGGPITAVIVGSSMLTISNNSFFHGAGSDVKTVSFETTSGNVVLQIGGKSSASFDHNLLSSSILQIATGLFYTVHWRSFLNLRITLLGGSILSMSCNQVDGVGGTPSAIFLSFGSGMTITAAGQSTMEVSQNVNENVFVRDTSCVVQWAAAGTGIDLQLLEKSSLIVRYNLANSHTAASAFVSTAVYSVYWSAPTLNLNLSQSSLEVEGNALSEVSVDQAFAVFWNSPEITATNFSIASVKRNVIINSNADILIAFNAYKLARVDVAFGSYFNISENSIHDSHSNSQLWAVVLGANSTSMSVAVLYNSSINADYNEVGTVTGENIGATGLVAARLSLVIHSSAVFSASGNTVTSGTLSKTLSAVQLSASELQVLCYGQSAFTIDSNAVISSAATTSLHSVLVTSKSGNITFIASYSSNMSFSQNAITGSLATLSLVAVHYIESASNIVVKVENLANFRVDGNSMQTTNGNSQSYAVYWKSTSPSRGLTFTVRYTSVFRFGNNSLLQQTSVSGLAAPVAIESSGSAGHVTIDISANSELQFNYNVMKSQTLSVGFLYSVSIVADNIRVNATNGSRLAAIANAVIQSYGTAVLVFYIASQISFDLALRDHSLLAIERSQVIKTFASVVQSIYLSDLTSVSVGANSEIAVKGTVIRDTTVTAVAVVTFVSHTGLSFRHFSAFIVEDTIVEVEADGVAQITVVTLNVPSFIDILDNSVLSFSGNSLSVTGDSFRSISIIDQIGTMGNTLRVIQESEFRVKENNLSYSNILGQLGMFSSLISCDMACYVSAGSSVTIEQNTVMTSNKAAVGFSGPLHLEDGAAVIVTGNTISSVIDVSSCPPAAIGIDTLLSTASSSSTSTNQLLVERNVVTLGSAGCYVFQFGNMSGLNILSITDNEVAAAAYFVQFGNVSAPIGSRMGVSDNKFHTETSTFITVSGTLWLTPSSKLFVQSNEIDVGTSSYQNPFELLSVSKHLLEGSPIIYFCSNILLDRGTSTRRFIDQHSTSPESLDRMATPCQTTTLSIEDTNSATVSQTLVPTNTKSAVATLSWTTSQSSKSVMSRTITNSWSVSASPSSTHSECKTNRSFAKTQSSLVTGSHSMPLLPPRTIIPVPPVVKAAEKVTNAAGVVLAVTAVASATGGQLGVANALMRLADCSSPDDDDDSLPILVHPLQFSFGHKKTLKHAAGAISDTLLVPLIVVVIALGPARLLIMWLRSVPSRVALVQIGWPTLLVLPFANLAEGIGVTTTTALISGEPFGVGMGLVALLVLLTFTGSWVWILIRVVPRSRLQLLRQEGATGLGKKRAFLMRMVRPSHRWVPLAPAEGSSHKKISLADLERYGNAVGDKRWYYADLASFVCSILVGVCECLPPSICRERAVIALIPALLQCGLSVLALIPLERFLQSLLAVCLVPMYIVVVVKVFSGSASDSEYDDLLDSAMAVFSSASNAIGIAIMGLGLVVGLWEVATTHRGRMRRKIPTKSSSDLDLPVLEDMEVRLQESNDEFDTPTIATNSSAVAPDDTNQDGTDAVEAALSAPLPLIAGQDPAELAVVQSILAQLREFEADLL